MHRSSAASGVPKRFMKVPHQMAAHTIFPGCPQAGWMRRQEQLMHCSLTPILQGEP